MARMASTNEAFVRMVNSPSEPCIVLGWSVPATIRFPFSFLSLSPDWERKRYEYFHTLHTPNRKIYCSRVFKELYSSTRDPQIDHSESKQCYHTSNNMQREFTISTNLRINKMKDFAKSRQRQEGSPLVSTLSFLTSYSSAP